MPKPLKKATKPIPKVGGKTKAAPPAANKTRSTTPAAKKPVAAKSGSSRPVIAKPAAPTSKSAAKPKLDKSASLKRPPAKSAVQSAKPAPAAKPASAAKPAAATKPGKGMNGSAPAESTFNAPVAPASAHPGKVAAAPAQAAQAGPAAKAGAAKTPKTASKTPAPPVRQFAPNAVIIPISPKPAPGTAPAAPKPAATKVAAKTAAKAAERAEPQGPRFPNNAPVPQAPVPTDGKPKKNLAGLNVRDLEHFRELLLAKRRELVGDMTSMEREALRSANGTNLSNLPLHMADMGTDNYEQEFTLGLVEKERGLLRDLNRALAKIQDGTFGICEGTGKPINRPRLEAQPWARFSIEYTRLLERGLVRR